MFRIRAQVTRTVISTLIHAVTLGAALGAFGCSQGADTPVQKDADALYLRGTTWSGGVVNVCYDGADVNNFALLSEVQRVVVDTWGRAANLTFPSRNPFPQTVWSQCNYNPTVYSNFSTVAIHFCGGSSNSVYCPARFYANKVVAANAFRGVTNHQGPVTPTFNSDGTYTPGVTHVSIIGDDPDPYLARTRYQIIHEFGHALGFEHEQNRPDNFDSAGNPIYCNQTADHTVSGGTYETPYDGDSIMNYCSTDVGGNLPNLLSSGDIAGVRNVYGRASAWHGFMITSDRNGTLAVNAAGGAAEGTVIKLHNACWIGNPDCTWTYHRGMLLSDTDPTLAINAYGGAAEGTVLKLTRACTASNPDCTWTYKGGQFVSDRDPTLAINAWGGAQLGTTLLLTRACTASNPDCTWTMPHVMVESYRDSTLAINAIGGAANGVVIGFHNGCSPSNSDCTWTFTKGQMLSDTNPSLGVNAYGGAHNTGTVLLNSACTASNPDCTWTWSHGVITSDNTSGGTFTMKATALHGYTFALTNSCSSSNPNCPLSGFFAEN